jgi:outer membrane protein assembly factor BamB
MFAPRRLLSLVLPAALLLGLGRSDRVPGQLPAPKGLALKLAEAKKALAKENWPVAAAALQAVLDAPRDQLLPEGDKPGTHRASARAEAGRLISALPAKGRTAYETAHGPSAAALLKKANDAGSAEMLEEVVRRYLYTEAGLEALRGLAGRRFAADDLFLAGRSYALLLQHRGLARWAPDELYQATLAFRASGEEKLRKMTLDALLPRVPVAGLRLGGRMLTRADVEKESAPLPTTDWPLYRRDRQRSQAGRGSAPVVESLWRRTTFSHANTGAALRDLATELDRLRRPHLPAAAPIALTAQVAGKPEPLVIYRSTSSLHAVHAATGKIAWRAPMSWSADFMFEGEKRASPMRTKLLRDWLGTYKTGGRPELLWDSSVVGTLSSDGKFVFAIEDFTLPPVPQTNVVYPRDVADAIAHNKLQAFDLRTEGKLVWEVGGRDPLQDLHDRLFLGPPLPLGNRLFVLTEKDKALSLVRLGSATGKFLGEQPLTQAAFPLVESPTRRGWAAHLAYADGTLVVPTNVGTLFGIDLLSNRVAWSYTYAKAVLENVPPMGAVPPGWVRLPDGAALRLGVPSNEWRVTAPVIANGKVVVAPPDASAVYCVDLRTGAPVWSRPRRPDDLYLAGVFNDKVLIVAKDRCRALGLARGDDLWEVATGDPSGQGVASGSAFYLPLRSTTRAAGPGVAVLDIDRGAVRTYLPAPGANVPGNLLLFGDLVVSQSATELVAYAQAHAVLAKLDKAIDKAPNDPALLAKRGSLRLAEGDLPGAVTDLRSALKNKPAKAIEATAQAKLHAALTDYLRRDFNAAEKYLPDYEALLGAVAPATDVAKARRRGTYLRLLALGRQKQGKVVEALTACVDLAGLSPNELLPAESEPALQASHTTWARGRIADLLRSSTPGQRKLLEADIERRAGAARDLKALRTFVTIFGTETAAGREARLRLADSLVAARHHGEADLLLQEVRRDGGPATSGRAVLMLAQMYTRMGMLHDALYHYRLLARDYAKVTINGKTGQEWLDDLATDKRFLHLLEAKAPPPPGRGRAVCTSARGAGSSDPVTCLVAHDGERLPLFQSSRFGVQVDAPALRALAPYSTERQWDVALKVGPDLAELVKRKAPLDQARLSYQALGHLIVLPLGSTVYGIDVVGRTVLWEHSPSGPARAPLSGAAFPVDARDRTVTALYTNGLAVRMGAPLPASPTAVAVLTSAGLTGLDPRTGKVLWSRTDVAPRSHLFSDGEHVCIVGHDKDGVAASSRAVRLANGSAVPVKDFTGLYKNRVGQPIGRRVLVSESGAKSERVLRLYDVIEGKDVWRQVYPAGSTVVRGLEFGLSGAVGPDGAVRLVEAATGKDVLKSKVAHGTIKPADLPKAVAVHAVADRDAIYLAVENPTKSTEVTPGSVRPLLRPLSGLRALPVNGDVYAFARAKGKLLWVNDVPNATLLLNGLDDLPVLLFTSTYTKVLGPGRTAPATAIRAYDKRSGKKAYEKDDAPLATTFDVLQGDAGKGTFALRGAELKLEVRRVEEKNDKR